jgi:alpha-glucosidase
MLADSPTFYEKDSTAMNFLSEVPTVWDETIPLLGEVGKLVTIARRSGEKWFVGGMAAEKSEEVFFVFDFLPEGNYKMTLITDGKNASELLRETYNITRVNTFTYEIKPTGGFVMIIEKI